MCLRENTITNCKSLYYELADRLFREMWKHQDHSVKYCLPSHFVVANLLRLYRGEKIQCEPNNKSQTFKRKLQAMCDVAIEKYNEYKAI